MTWEEIDYEFEIAPIWIDWICTRIMLNTKITCPTIAKHQLHLDTITKFKNYKVNDSSGDNTSMVEHWKIRM